MKFEKDSNFFLKNRAELPDDWKPVLKQSRVPRTLSNARRRVRIPPNTDWCQIKGRIYALDAVYPVNNPSLACRVCGSDYGGGGGGCGCDGGGEGGGGCQGGGGADTCAGADVGGGGCAACAQGGGCDFGCAGADVGGGGFGGGFGGGLGSGADPGSGQSGIAEGTMAAASDVSPSAMGLAGPSSLAGTS